MLKNIQQKIPNIPKKILIPIAVVLAILLLAIVIYIVVASNSEDEDTDPDAVLTQAMQTALARMTETPSVVVTVSSTWTSFPTFTVSPTGSLASPTITSAPTQAPPPSSGCDVAGFVADITIPDGTEVEPGKKFTKIWELRNSGTCTWNENYDVIFYSGAQMQGTSPQQLTTGEILPGQTVQIAIDMVAPAQAGRHIGNWVLRNDNGKTFGIGGQSPFYVDISVTGTPVVSTATQTLSGAPTQTNTPRPTNTSVPAVTDTVAPKPSDTPIPTDTTIPYP